MECVLESSLHGVTIWTQNPKYHIISLISPYPFPVNCFCRVSSILVIECGQIRNLMSS